MFHLRNLLLASIGHSILRQTALRPPVLGIPQNRSPKNLQIHVRSQILPDLHKVYLFLFFNSSYLSALLAISLGTFMLHSLLSNFSSICCRQSSLWRSQVSSSWIRIPLRSQRPLSLSIQVAQVLLFITHFLLKLVHTGSHMFLYILYSTAPGTFLYLLLLGLLV